MCARKSFGNLGDAAQNVVGFVTFGDPFPTWEAGIDFPALPSHVSHIAFCKSAPTDPLCGSVKENWPSTPWGVIDHLKEIWASVDQANMNGAQKASLASIIIALPTQAIQQLGTLGRDLINGNIRRWMLTPAHFWYGMDGSTSQASDRILALL